MLLALLIALAGAPEDLTDAMTHLHADVYDLTPERRASWEASRLSGNAAWLSLGSLTSKEFEAVERGHVNLGLARWLSVRGEARNDRDRQGAVTRVALDALAQVKPGLWLGVTGSPRDDSIGGALLVAGQDRLDYLFARAATDHAHVEARAAFGPLSIYALGYVSGSRDEAQLHGRFTGGFEGDLRFDVTRLRGEGLRRTISAARAQALLGPGPFRLRLGVRLTIEKARGADYRHSRIEPGARMALFWERGIHQVELGYALAAPDQDGPAIREWVYQDKAYSSWEASLSARFHLRALLGWEIANGRFGGGSGSLLALF